MNTVENITGPSVTGKVVSNKMQKSIIVRVERKVKHHLYGKYVKRYSKMCAEDTEGTCKVGDIVMIKQCRPLSKTKHWTLVQVLERYEQDVIE